MGSIDSTFRAATQLAIAAKVKRFGLFHHDPDRREEDLDRQAAPCQQLVAQAQLNSECFGAAEGMEIAL